MAMPGTGCFVAWWDVAAESASEHDNWHTHEHMIERVAIPGFLRGSRYRALDAGLRVCTIYLGETLATFTSRAYVERLDNPTPWSARCFPLFRSMNRSLCTVAASFGHGIGGYLLTMQLSAREGDGDRLKKRLIDEALPALAHRPGLNGAHLLIADKSASQTGSREKALRGVPDAVADWIVLVEGYDRAAVEMARAELVGTDGIAAHGAANSPVTGLYGLDFTLGEDEAKKLWKGPDA
jgi:hypothetical protein